ncbi:MAG: hypothetical protein ACPGU7_14225 [Gammaproteobacteria bacterium]
MNSAKRDYTCWLSVHELEYACIPRHHPAWRLVERYRAILDPSIDAPASWWAEVLEARDAIDGIDDFSGLAARVDGFWWRRFQAFHRAFAHVHTPHDESTTDSRYRWWWHLGSARGDAVVGSQGRHCED